MKQIHRRIIVLLFFLIFFVLAPIIILYAAGYRYDFTRKKFLKTGIIVLKSAPKKADVYIDGQKSKYQTDAMIKNLLPNTYAINVQKDGFFSWSRNMTVEANRTTFAENIILFKKEFPTVTLPQVSLVIPAPNRQTFVFWTKSGANKLNFSIQRTQEATPVQLATLPVQQDSISVYWINDATIAVFSSTTNDIATLYIMSINSNKNPVAERMFTEIPIKQIEKRGDHFYTISNRTLYEIQIGDAQNITLTPIFTAPQPMLAALLKDSKFYFFANTVANDTVLYETELPPGDTVITRLNKLPFSTDITFIDTDDNLLLIDDRDNNLVTFIDPSDNRIVDTFYDAQDIQWNPSHSHFIYHTEFEIWLVEKTTKVFETDGASYASFKKELITRLSKPITEISWHPTYDYLFYLTDSGITIIELPVVGKIETIPITTAENMHSYFFNSDATILYFTGKIGQQEGLWEQNL